TRDIVDGKVHKAAKDSSADYLINLNHRPDVLQIIFVKSVGGADAGELAKGEAVSFPAPAAPGAVKLSYRLRAGWPGSPFTLQMDRTGRPWGGDGNQNWGIVIAGNTDTGIQFSRTIAHEVGHYFGLSHREPPALLRGNGRPFDTVGIADCVND